mgnify:CR=1 FL=1
MKKVEITNTHGETKTSLKKAINKYSGVKKAETKITVIMLCMDGHGSNEISRMICVGRDTARRYISSFNEGGLEKLLGYKTSPGRKSRLSEQEKDLICDALLSTPKEMGCGESVNWTTTEVQTFIKNEFNKDMTSVGILKMLNRMGYSFTRPTYVLARASKKNR